MESLLLLLGAIPNAGQSISVSIDPFLPVQLEQDAPHGFVVRVMVDGAVYVGRAMQLTDAYSLLEAKLKNKFHL